ncbi:hypothetical protein [Streptomyces sp. NPDC052179]|uniref:hypothetical protein n=1 Tax=Streptomyces sp. NPDC052179 TaxID=3155680 RepID=UPI00341D5B9F
MTTAPDQQPAAQGAEPPNITINNNVAASASATAVAGGFGRAGRRRQSFWVHLWLFLFTAGLGNIAYAMYISRWNRRRGW